MVNSILTYNIEVLHNINKREIQSLDKIDLYLIRRSMCVSSKSSRSLLLLELGLTSVEYIIKRKRINYLQNLLQSESSSISKKVFLKQVSDKIKGDFVSLVLKDLEECNITFSFNDIEQMSKRKFKCIVRDATNEACFKLLIKEKLKGSKGSEISYHKLETQPYLMSRSNLSIDAMRKILKN